MKYPSLLEVVAGEMLPNGKNRPALVIARSAATKQSPNDHAVSGDCFAALEMTGDGRNRPLAFYSKRPLRGKPAKKI